MSFREFDNGEMMKIMAKLFGHYINFATLSLSLSLRYSLTASHIFIIRVCAC